MVRTIALAVCMMLGGCSVEGMDLPDRIAAKDEGKPHFRLLRDGTMMFGINREF